MYARKIVTHERYSFYNPKQHPFFDKEMGRIIYFEGTYAHTFSPLPGSHYVQVSKDRRRFFAPVSVEPGEGHG